MCQLALSCCVYSSHSPLSTFLVSFFRSTNSSGWQSNRPRAFLLPHRALLRLPPPLFDPPLGSSCSNCWISQIRSDPDPSVLTPTRVRPRRFPPRPLELPPCSRPRLRFVGFIYPGLYLDVQFLLGMSFFISHTL